MATWDLEWTPSEEVLATEYNVYSETEGGGGTLVHRGSTRATRMRLDRMPEVVDRITLWVAPIVNGVEADREDWSSTTVWPPSPADLDLPPDVTGFTCTQKGDDIVAEWDSVDLSDDPLADGFEVREGSSWEVARKLTTYPRGTVGAAWGWAAAGTITYLLKARNRLGQVSANPATAVVVVVNHGDYVEQGEHDEKTGSWGGTKDGTATTGANLQIEPAPTLGQDWTNNGEDYTWPPLLPHVGEGTYVTDAQDAGAVVEEKIEVTVGLAPEVPTITGDRWRFHPYPDVDASGSPLTMGTTGLGSQVYGDGNPVAGPQVEIEVDTTPDDPAGTPTWDGYRKWRPGATYRYRGVRLRLTLASVWFGNLVCDGFTWRRKRRNWKDEASVTVSGTGGTAVTFAAPFTAAPKVVAAVVYTAPTAGYSAQVSGISTTGCTVRVFDETGTEVGSGTVHVLAMGV